MSAMLDAPMSDDQDLLTARYGAADVPATGPVNDVIRALFAHRSVRGYLPTALPQGTVETLIAAAQSAQPAEISGIVKQEVLVGNPYVAALRAGQARDAANLDFQRSQFTDRYPGLPSLQDQVERESSVLAAAE